MTEIISFLALCQALGAFVGAGMTIWAELSYVHAARKGDIDRAERAHLRVLGHGLRFGLVLLLLSSFALVVAAYVAHTQTQPAVTSAYWTSVVLALFIIYVAWALSHKHLSFAFGSAIAFAAWWFLAYLAIGFIPPLSFGAAAAFFAIAAGIFYGLLQYARMLAHPGHAPRGA